MKTQFVISACEEHPNCKHLLTIDQAVYPTGIIEHEEVEYIIESISTHLDELIIIVWLKEIE